MLESHWWNGKDIVQNMEWNGLVLIMAERRLNSTFTQKTYSLTAELQICASTGDNSKIIFLISRQKHVVTPHLGETVLMIGHSICFKREVWKIIPKLSFSPLI